MKLLNKIGMYKLLSAIDSSPVHSGPGVMAIIAPIGSFGTIDAGRLLSRQWTLLNQSGLAVHPYYVVADQLARLRTNQVPIPLEPLARQVAKHSDFLRKLE